MYTCSRDKDKLSVVYILPECTSIVNSEKDMPHDFLVLLAVH